MGEETLLRLIGNIGVPAVVCLYTLFRVNVTLKDLTGAINKLTVDVDRRLEKLEDKTRELSNEMHTVRSDFHALHRHE